MVKWMILMMDPDTIDKVDQLISDEEDNSTDEDETRFSGIINDESDEEHVEVNLSYLTLNDKNLLAINHFDLLNDVSQVMKKSRLLVELVRNHNIISEFINKSVSINNGDVKSGGLVLDMLIRWNSSFLLLDRLMIHKDIINSMFAYS